ncbi:MAG: hypothetical protein JWQ62_1123 [Lacunisphaera sp.]|nr:hypothetical protein [Lacunisphaera sp.]
MAQNRPIRHTRLTPRFQIRYTGQYFLRGILVISPVLITLSVLFWIFTKLDGLLHPYVTTPGEGLAALLIFILAVGWFSTFRFVKRASRWVGTGLEHTPGVSFIYTSVRDFFEAFVGNKRRFNQAVLVDVMADDVWLVGFLTDDEPAAFNLGAAYVSVYVPQAYNVGGQLYLLKRTRVRMLDNLNAGDVMKYAVTGGAVEISEKDTAITGK